MAGLGQLPWTNWHQTIFERASERAVAVVVPLTDIGHVLQCTLFSVIPAHSAVDVIHMTCPITHWQLYLSAFVFFRSFRRV